MISSALYPKIDPEHRAVFSRAIITGLLREKLGFKNVVISDDVGAAHSVGSVPVGERATQFVAAGGDIVLTVVPSTVAAMVTSIVQKSGADPTFGVKVDAAVKRVLALKSRQGLVVCG
jgi:beta-N-acetylhexosaminidase